MSREHPHSEHAELSVLGAVFLRPELPSQLELSPEAFYTPRNRLVWNAMVSLANHARAIDPVTLADRLERAGKLEAVGMEFVAQLAVGEFAVTPDNVEHHVGIMRDHLVTRQGLLVAGKIQQWASRGIAGDELIDRAQHELASIKQAKSIEAVSVRDLTRRRARELTEASEAAARGDVVFRLATGMPALDLRLGGGLPRGYASAMVARPGNGKTAVMTTMALRVPCPALLFVFEEVDRDLADRLLSGKTGIPAIDIGALKLDANDFGAVISAADGMPGDVYVVKARGMTDVEIVRAARRMVPELGIGFVGVDYLNRVELTADTGLRNDQRIGHALSLMDNAAGDLDVTWMIAAQANREAAKANRAPFIYEARDCGEIEQICKLALIVHRPHMKRPRNEGGDDEIQIIIDKQNMGTQSVGCRFAWDGPTMTISPMTTAQESFGGMA